MDWIDIRDYEGLYQVNSNGEIRSLDRVTVDCIGRKRKFFGKKLSPAENGSGYLQVMLCKNGEKKQEFLHKLVAQAFIPNPNNHSEVNHINHNKLDCRAENLEWCTRKENMIKMAEFYGIKSEDVLCSECGKKISRGSEMCQDCLGLSNRKVKRRPSKEDLLKMIATKSFSQIGREFGVSDNAIRRWCKDYDLPYRKKDILRLK